MSETQPLDCRGLQCPRPVVMARKALDAMPDGALDVLVSLEVQAANLVQLAEAAGWPTEVEQFGDHFRVTVHKSGPSTAAPASAPVAACGPPIANATFLFGSDELGHGDPDLGRLLTQLMLRTLADSETPPRRLLFLNTGVRLACEGSPVLDALRALEDRGVEILACGTCLDYLALMAKLGVGRITNMHDIVESLVSAQPLIAPT